MARSNSFVVPTIHATAPLLKITRSWPSHCCTVLIFLIAQANLQCSKRSRDGRVQENYFEENLVLISAMFCMIASSFIGLKFLYDCLLFHWLENFESTEEEALRRRLADLGVLAGSRVSNVRFIKTSDLINVDRLIAIGFDPRVVSKERLYERLNIGEDNRDDDVFAKSTFDALVARGFALDEADLIILDERMEPALKDLPARIRGEN